MTYWAYRVDEAVIFRPRRAPPMWPLVGQLCTVRARYEGMVLASGERMATFGGVYDVEFATGETLCAWEHDLIAMGARRWIN